MSQIESHFHMGFLIPAWNAPCHFFFTAVSYFATYPIPLSYTATATHPPLLLSLLLLPNTTPVTLSQPHALVRPYQRVCRYVHTLSIFFPSTPTRSTDHQRFSLSLSSFPFAIAPLSSPPETLRNANTLQPDGCLTSCENHPPTSQT